jgi:hypothetical protein
MVCQDPLIFKGLEAARSIDSAGRLPLAANGLRQDRTRPVRGLAGERRHHVAGCTAICFRLFER